MTDPVPRLLVVEDDDALRPLVAGRLADAGYRVETAATGPDAVAAAETARADGVPFSLVLLDVMLPGYDGLEVCRRLRARQPLLYVILLTARADELDRVIGLEVGADDYVTKPFGVQELLARVRAALRRMQRTAEHLAAPPEEKATGPLSIGDLTLDPARHRVTLGGDEVRLTVREFELLHFLLRHPDRPFTRMQLLEGVWGETYEGYDRTIDSHVQRLRAKIEADPANPRFVRTVWGVGYKLDAEGVGASEHRGI